LDKTPTRHYAHPFDRPVDGPADQHGVNPSPDAIGGYYGLGWYQYYLDHKTGERFKVHCSDGVNGGKDAYPDHILGWMEKQYLAIKKRTIAEAEAGAAEVRLSTAEWNIMLTRIHVGWLDGQDTTKDRGHRLLDEGRIGTCRGVPVIVDAELECPLEEPSAEPQRRRVAG
jgi:hypothetical protein